MSEKDYGIRSFMSSSLSLFKNGDNETTLEGLIYLFRLEHIPYIAEAILTGNNNTERKLLSIDDKLAKTVEETVTSRIDGDISAEECMTHFNHIYVIKNNTNNLRTQLLTIFDAMVLDEEDDDCSDYEYNKHIALIQQIQFVLGCVDIYNTKLVSYKSVYKKGGKKFICRIRRNQ